ncbi:MAG: glycosyltransferase family 4 protein [Proteobacteria bacterium]|nr:glycosyltransferase family 4 protein [Pseudomonadota bacterium]
MTFLVSFRAVQQLCKPSSRFYVRDIPNERSLHENPTPRNGGLGVVFAISVGYAIAFVMGIFPREYLIIAGIMISLAGIGYLDDRINLKSSIRFAIHFTAAGITVASLGSFESLSIPLMAPLELGFAAVPFTILLIVWLINLYNFMDGMDGFAGGMSLFGFAAFAALMLHSQGWNEATFAIVPAVAAGGFLIFNFPPAKIFLGDAGSTALGYLCSTCMLIGNTKNEIPLWIMVMIFSPFIADATVTLITRIFKRERFWEAHRSHFYQRLVLSGLSHRQVLIFEYLLMLMFIIFGLTSAFNSPYAPALLVTWAVLLLLVGLGINLKTAQSSE